jgi:hypothetical protein
MKYLLVIAILAIAGCTTLPVEQPSFARRYKNACLPEAIAMTQGLKQAGIQARVLRISTNKWNHAICVYLYPSGSNTLWGWDSYWKSNRLRAFSDEPNSIAKAWINTTLSDAIFLNSQFLDSNSFK